jgi:hypothetical protein
MTMVLVRYLATGDCAASPLAQNASTAIFEENRRSLITATAWS